MNKQTNTNTQTQEERSEMAKMAEQTRTNEDYREFVVEYLTDYNDNFEGEPCSEIVDEVLGYLDIHEGMSEDDCIQAIEDICEELFD